MVTGYTPASPTLTIHWKYYGYNGIMACSNYFNTFHYKDQCIKNSYVPRNSNLIKKLFGYSHLPDFKSTTCLRYLHEKSTSKLTTTVPLFHPHSWLQDSWKVLLLPAKDIGNPIIATTTEWNFKILWRENNVEKPQKYKKRPFLLDHLH